MGYYERRLPHWQPEGAALFITWRLHGVLPLRLRVSNAALSGKVFVAVDRELGRAAAGPQWLRNDRVAEAVAGTLRYGENPLQLYALRAWVLMSNHVHILVHPNVELPRITKAVKNYLARLANGALGRRGLPFWQDESYDHWVRDGRELEQIIRYIEANPVDAGLVERPEQWRWSSAYDPELRQAGRPAPPNMAGGN